MKTVLIAIQARSTSSRLPGKIHLQIGGKPILQWVIDACQHSQRWLQREAHSHGVGVQVCVVTPKGDATVPLYRNQLPVLEGDEDDVLSRYVKAQEQFKAEFVVRVTADCLFIPTFVISKHIKTALNKDADYVTNVHYRTFDEGFDCEVLSSRLVQWLDKHATSKEDREHVTTLIGPGRPFPFTAVDGGKNILHILQPFDRSGNKTSVDTQEDFDRAAAIFERFKVARQLSKQNGSFSL